MLCLFPYSPKASFLSVSFSLWAQKHVKVICYDKTVVCSRAASLMLWLTVLYLSIVCSDPRSPRQDTALFTLIFLVMFVTRGPRLRFSLYTAFTDPGGNYRQWSSTSRLSSPPAEHKPPLWCDRSNHRHARQNIQLQPQPQIQQLLLLPST